jgi:hypothetical protein
VPAAPIGAAAPKTLGPIQQAAQRRKLGSRYPDRLVFIDETWATTNMSALMTEAPSRPMTGAPNDEPRKVGIHEHDLVAVTHASQRREQFGTEIRIETF